MKIVNSLSNNNKLSSIILLHSLWMITTYSDQNNLENISRIISVCLIGNRDTMSKEVMVKMGCIDIRDCYLHVCGHCSLTPKKCGSIYNVYINDYTMKQMKYNKSIWMKIWKKLQTTISPEPIPPKEE